MTTIPADVRGKLTRPRRVSFTCYHNRNTGRPARPKNMHTTAGDGPILFARPTMELDEELCLCFHVTRRKVVNYLRRERPVRASQLSECGGAGTGCGWCRPFLEQLFAAAQDAGNVELPAQTAYAAGRARYRTDRDEDRSAPDSGAEES